MGKVGRDSFADFILRILNDYKVDTSGIKQAEKRGTAFTFAAINKKGERGFFHYTGANEELTLEDINFNLIKGSKILHIAGSYLMPQFDGEPTAKVLQKAKEYGVTTSLDTAWNSTVKNWQKIIEPCLSYLDIILPAIEEARMFTGRNRKADIADYLLSYGLKVVGLKMGEKGCYIKSRKEEIYLPAYPVKVVDTSGAGDAFAAGFLTGMVKGWPLKQTGQFANAVGALCVQAIGCTAGVKSLPETLTFMGKY
jgi:sugar/nucleoside kinase (ribokinase family)